MVFQVCMPGNSGLNNPSSAVLHADACRLYGHEWISAGVGPPRTNWKLEDCLHRRIEGLCDGRLPTPMVSLVFSKTIRPGLRRKNKKNICPLWLDSRLASSRNSERGPFLQAKVWGSWLDEPGRISPGTSRLRSDREKYNKNKRRKMKTAAEDFDGGDLFVEGLCSWIEASSDVRSKR